MLAEIESIHKGQREGKSKQCSGVLKCLTTLLHNKELSILSIIRGISVHLHYTPCTPVLTTKNLNKQKQWMGKSITG